MRLVRTSPTLLDLLCVLLLASAAGLTAACHSALHTTAPRPDAALPDPGDAGGAVGAVGAADVGSTAALKLVAGQVGGAGDLDGIGAAARFRSPVGVATDGAGHLFVADENSHVVRRVDLATGAVTTLAGSPGQAGSSDGVGAAARFNWPVGIVSDGAGNLFVADSNNNSIRKLVVATGAVTTFAGSAGLQGTADGIGVAARFSGPTALAMDGTGILYVADGRVIRKVVVATGAVSTVATLVAPLDAYGLPMPPFSLGGVTSDGAGHLFVADTGLAVIWKADLATGAVVTFAGGGLKSTTIDRPDGSKVSRTTGGYADGVGQDAWFSSPVGMVSDGAGNLLVADRENCAIRSIAIATGEVTTLVGSVDHCEAVDGVGPNAQLGGPTGLVTDLAGNLFVTDETTHTVRKVVLATRQVSTIAGSPEHAGSADGIGAEARFHRPQALASDGEGNVFVADSSDHTVRKIEVATGTVTLFAGSPASEGSYDDRSVDGIGTAARFSYLHDLAADGLGNLFVTDGKAIRQIVIATRAVTTLAGSSTEDGFLNGTGAAARFDSPTGLASDGAGNLFVADTSTIRKVVTATGEVTTFAGTLAGDCADGIGTGARFWRPSDLTADHAGNLFVVDTSCGTVRKIVIATGQVTTLAGAFPPSPSADGIGPSARFKDPSTVACDNQGHLFVAEADSHTVRKIDIATRAVTTVVGQAERMGVILGPLPAGLSTPAGLAFGPSGELLISDSSDHSILAAWF